MRSHTVLVVDDEANMRRVLEIMLARRGYKTEAAADGREAFEYLAVNEVDLVISDLRMPGMNGLELLRKLREGGDDTPLIMMTAQGSIESAVEAMKLGACDYLLRPFDVEALDLAMSRVFNASETLRQNGYLRGEVERNWDGLVGESTAMQQVRRQILQVASAKTSIMLTGETGTGKEVVARAIHQASGRAKQLFVAVNCAAIPAEILESELFGHEKGAFTGAVRERIGKFELAQGGTLFLDEITEMPIALQAKLLRALQEGVIERVGGNRAITLDVRVIAATNRSPKQAVQESRLREDLYYRLNVFTIELPPLRARREDIPALAAHLAARLANGKPPQPILSPEALEYLQLHQWPGNVRELGNMVERGLLLSGGRMLQLAHLPLENSAPAMPALSVDVEALDSAVEGLETRLILEALQRSSGNKTRAAQLLRISERSMFYKIKKYGIRFEEAG